MSMPSASTISSDPKSIAKTDQVKSEDQSQIAQGISPPQILKILGYSKKFIMRIINSF